MQFILTVVVFGILLGNAESYVVTTNNDHGASVKVNTFVPEFGASDLAIATLISEKERDKLKYEIVADTVDPIDRSPSTQKLLKSKSLKDEFVEGLAGLIWGTTITAGEVIKKKDEVKNAIVHDIAGVELETAETVVAVKDTKDKVKDELVHDIAGVEIDTAGAVIEANDVEEKVEKVVEETVDEAKKVWGILNETWYYLKIVLEVSIPIIGVLLILYIAMKLRKYYYLVKRHSASTRPSKPNEGDKGNQIPMQPITPSAPYEY